MLFAQGLDFSQSQKKGFAWEFIVGPEVVFQYITQSLCWLRMCMLEEPGKDLTPFGAGSRSIPFVAARRRMELRGMVQAGLGIRWLASVFLFGVMGG